DPVRAAVAPRTDLRRHRARGRRRAARLAEASRRRASPHLVRAALPADAGRADGARRRAGARHARRAGAARRRPRVGGDPGTAAVEQVVAVLIAGSLARWRRRSTITWLRHNQLTGTTSRLVCAEPTYPSRRSVQVNSKDKSPGLRGCCRAL